MFVDYQLLIKYFLCISSNLKVESQLYGGMELLSAFQEVKAIETSRSLQIAIFTY